MSIKVAKNPQKKNLLVILTRKTQCISVWYVYVKHKTQKKINQILLVKGINCSFPNSFLCFQIKNVHQKLSWKILRVFLNQSFKKLKRI